MPRLLQTPRHAWHIPICTQNLHGNEKPPLCFLLSLWPFSAFCWNTQISLQGMLVHVWLVCVCVHFNPIRNQLLDAHLIPKTPSTYFTVCFAYRQRQDIMHAVRQHIGGGIVMSDGRGQEGSPLVLLSTFWRNEPMDESALGEHPIDELGNIIHRVTCGTCLNTKSTQVHKEH